MSDERWFNARVHSRRRAGRCVAVAALALIGFLSRAAPTGAVTGSTERSRATALIDQQNLRLAAYQVEAQALAVGALREPVSSSRPAAVLYQSVDALLRAARHDGAAAGPIDTRDLMGPVPFNLAHPVAHRPWHRHITATHSLRLFRGSVYVGSSAGIGMHTVFRHARPAPFQSQDGVYVDPHIPAPVHPAVAAVAIHAALKKLGQPYVWAAAGPETFDCSGLVRYAYGRAGIRLTHFTGTQWNEGRLIPPRQALPGDLVLVGHTLHHVGIYLGAGWMLNAPFTGHYVDVVPVPRHVAGLVRP
jgi:cell wall-associated NlpC family hydrolase